MGNSSSSTRRTLGGCLAIIIGMFLCGGLSVGLVDQLCYHTLSRRLPIYPNSEVLTQRFNMFRPLGIGETYIELAAPANTDTVRQWYAQTAGVYSREAIMSRDFTYRLATAERSFVRQDANDPDAGTFVQLYGTCVQ